VLVAELEGFHLGFEDGEARTESGDAGHHYGKVFFDAGERMLVSLLESVEGLREDKHGQ